MERQEGKSLHKHGGNIAVFVMLLSLGVVHVSCSDGARPARHQAFTVVARNETLPNKNAMRQANGIPMRSGIVRNDASDTNEIKACLNLLQGTHLAPPTTYDVFIAPRTTVGSSVGAVGVFWDYVFYDDAERIIATVRRFVD